ncbi:hypothetical protein [Micromonospora sp. 4G55]|uniref:hypothetical protein n=1 Tax=Micromonospora sp. 4G55 TaxID=2806102 RepID=UPI001A55C898|nr:hypothetical protein [Micromonospora sp. 4G55]MBM0256013.1 hypothetical protein [Micromonospora sp. 4G55]
MIGIAHDDAGSRLDAFLMLFRRGETGSDQAEPVLLDVDEDALVAVGITDGESCQLEVQGEEGTQSGLFRLSRQSLDRLDEIDGDVACPRSRPARMPESSV